MDHMQQPLDAFAGEEVLSNNGLAVCGVNKGCALLCSGPASMRIVSRTFCLCSRYIHDKTQKSDIPVINMSFPDDEDKEMYKQSIA